MHSMPGSRSIWSGAPGSSGSIEYGAIWIWASGRSSSGRVLKNPTMSDGGAASGPCRVVRYCEAAACWPASVLEQLVVPEVFREPELQHEHAVLAHPGADVRAVDHDVDAGGPQRVRGTDAGELEDLGRGDGARREDHLARGEGLDAVAPSHADRAAAVEHHPVDDRVQRDGQVGTVHDRVQERVGRADPLAVADRRHRVADAFLVGLVEVPHPPPTELGAGGDHVLEQRVGPVDGRDVQRAAGAADGGATERVVLDLLEDRQHVVPAPPRVAEPLERVVVRAIAAVVDHAVDRSSTRRASCPAPSTRPAATARTGASGSATRSPGRPAARPNPPGMAISGLLSQSPASTSSTLTPGSAERRLASTQPAGPAPTMT